MKLAVSDFIAISFDQPGSLVTLAAEAGGGVSAEKRVASHIP